MKFNFLMSVILFFLGTESETMAFMAVCVETVKKYGLDDFRTPVFIFERLCSIIYPVCNNSISFLLFIYVLLLSETCVCVCIKTCDNRVQLYYFA